MAGLRTESRSSVFSCLVFVWVSTYICLGQENGFFRSVKFQRLETINMIECGGNFSGNLVSIRIAEKTRNKTFLASYRERDQECKTTSTFSSCPVDKDTRLLKVIVLDLAENETREYECNIARLTQTDEPFTSSHSLNVTRTRSGAIMNEFFRSEKIQRLETIHVIECGSSFGGNLISLRIADKTRNKTFLASYRERDQECKTTSTFSSCLVDKDTRLLKVIVLDLAENETREYECNIARLTPTDEPFTASHSLNVTRTRSGAIVTEAKATFPTRGVSNHQEMASNMVNVSNSGFQNCGQCARDYVIIGIFVGAGALASGAGVFVVSKKFLKRSNYEKPLPRRKRPKENVLYSDLQAGATASPPGVQSAGTINDNISEDEEDDKYTELRDA